MNLKIFKIAVLLFLIPLFTMSCDDDTLIEVKGVDCYFQYEYVNYAWGFNHGGFIITPLGEIYTFDKNTPWVFADKNQISNTDLQNNIKSCVKMDSVIRSSDLEYYKNLAVIAMAGKISEPAQQGADMGALSCKILVPDPTPVTYREIILSQTGDIEFHNQSPEAGVIAAWLKKILNK